MLLDENCVPSWAHDTLVALGLGFEVETFNESFWSQFVAEFGHIECELAVYQNYFSHYVKSEIKSGGVQTLISQLKREQRSTKGRKKKIRYQYNYADNAPNEQQQRTPRLSALQEFELKYADYLGDD